MINNDNINSTYGFIETRGITTILYAIDDMLKGSNIKLIGFKRYGSAYHTAAIKGSTNDVINAINTGEKAVDTIAKKTEPGILNEGLSQLISTHIISRSVTDIIDIFFNNPHGCITIDNKAMGFIDARGLISLIAAADKMTKACSVEILTYRKMGSGRLNLAITGDITAVEDAIDLGTKVVKQHGRLIGYSIIAKPHSELTMALK